MIHCIFEQLGILYFYVLSPPSGNFKSAQLGQTRRLEKRCRRNSQAGSSFPPLPTATNNSQVDLMFLIDTKVKPSHKDLKMLIQSAVSGRHTEKRVNLAAQKQSRLEFDHRGPSQTGGGLCGLTNGCKQTGGRNRDYFVYQRAWKKTVGGVGK